MKIGKYSPENLLREIVKLDPVEFIGICRVLGVKAYKTDDIEVENVEEDVEEDVECARAKTNAIVTPEPRDFNEMWDELCDKIDGLNRTQRRNLGALVYAATKREK